MPNTTKTSPAASKSRLKNKMLFFMISSLLSSG
jgi:hypothetical protein